MKNIFISYRRSDSEYVVGRIYDSLTLEYGEKRIFKDLESIPLGSDFRKEIEKAVNSCEVLIAIIGDQWISVKDKNGNLRLFDENDFVRIEIESALNRNISVIPVLINNSKIPNIKKLPESLKDITYRNAISIRPDPDFKGDIKKLNKSINKIIKRKNNNFKITAVLFFVVVVISTFLLYIYYNKGINNTKLTINFDQKITEKIENIPLKLYKKNSSYVEDKLLTAGDIISSADKLGTDTSVIRAILENESYGSGFYIDGRPRIIFEGHKFWRELKKLNLNPTALQVGNEDIIYKKWSTKHYTGTADGEYNRLSRAMKISEVAAYRSTSWGMFQMMGFNLPDRFSNINEFVKSMYVSEKEQLYIFIDFLKQEGIDKDLISLNWSKFDRRYNGGRFKENYHDSKLKMSYQKYLLESFDKNTLIEHPVIYTFQLTMKKHGYYSGKLNGLLTSETRNAIKEYRKNEKI